jgi:hypothetical protein
MYFEQSIDGYSVGNKKARPLSEPSLLLQISQGFYRFFTTFPWCMSRFTLLFAMVSPVFALHHVSMMLRPTVFALAIHNGFSCIHILFPRRYQQCWPLRIPEASLLYRLLETCVLGKSLEDVSGDKKTGAGPASVSSTEVPKVLGL